MRKEREKRELSKLPAKRSTPDVTFSMIDYSSSSSSSSSDESVPDERNDTLSPDFVAPNRPDVFDPTLNMVMANLVADSLPQPAGIPDSFFDQKERVIDDIELLRDLNKEIQRSELLDAINVDAASDPSSLFEGLEERRAKLAEFKASLQDIQKEKEPQKTNPEPDSSSDDDLQWRVKVVK